MRLHTDVIELGQLWHAATLAGVTFDTCSRHGSRSRDHAWDVKLFGDSPRRPNSGKVGAQSGEFAATWDQWGVLLGALFNLDPQMIANGDHGYVGIVDFDWQTGDRFTEPATFDQWHRYHRWNFDGEVATGTYLVHSCKCGAIKRFRMSGVTREQLGLVTAA